MKSITLFIVILSIVINKSIQTEQQFRYYTNPIINTTKLAPIKTLSQVTNNTRTIQRLVGGHLQHVATAPISTVFATTTTAAIKESDKNSKIYFRRKVVPVRAIAKPNNTSERVTFVYPLKKPFSLQEPNYSDAGLLETDNNGIDNWDSGLLRSSAGAGKEVVTKKPGKDEKQKTLSDQVAEGKYGLIQKELFEKEPKRPGVLSYSANSEVPKDTDKNYGGLDAEDIWLAEDHLLVLKGGNLNKKDREDIWKPIDNYQAPRRQVKIPLNPKVPPPFPVQFNDNGPLQFVGNNQIPFFNPFTNQSVPSSGNGDFIGYPQTEANRGNTAYVPSGPGKNEGSPNNSGGYQYPPPIPPWFFNDNNQTFQNPFIAGPPFFGPSFGFPNSSLSDANYTDFIDEDDPSLFYPPPYSFVYKNNYSNPVPAGPLVPGIVLPPPPNFFGRLEEEEGEPTTTTTITTTSTTTQRPYIQRIPQTKPTKTTTTHHTTTKYRESERDYIDNNVYKKYQQQSQQPQIYSTRLRPTQAPPSMATTTTVKTVTTLKKIIVQPTLLSFVPQQPQILSTTGPETTTPTFSKSNPIYYEYFDARQPQPLTSAITEIAAPQLNSNNEQKRPRVPPSNAYLPVRPSFDYSKYYYVTPKPEIKPNGISSNFVPVIGKSGSTSLDQTYSFKPVEPFDQEIATIRQTLQFYNNNPINTNTYSTQLPRTPKAKAVYEYSFDASDSSTSKPFGSQKIRFDSEPFKPMVKYSSPIDSDNGFKAIPAYSVHSSSTNQPQKSYEDITQKYINLFGQRISPDETSTLTRNIEFTTLNPTVTTKRPWITIEKQIVREYFPSTKEPQHQQLQQRPNGYHRGYSRNNGLRNFNNYQYQRQEPIYQNNQNYYPQQKQSNADPYIKQINLIRQQLNSYPQPQQQQLHLQQKILQPQQQSYQVNLINDTFVNYINPRPTVNPHSEYVLPIAQQQQQKQQQQQREQYQQLQQQQREQYQQQREQYQQQQGNLPNRYYQQQQQQQPQPQRPVSLHRDVLINYKYPLPPVNPDSEFITPSNQQQPQQQQQIYRKPIQQQTPVIQYRLPGDQAHVYFITPRELRYKK